VIWITGDAGTFFLDEIGEVALTVQANFRARCKSAKSDVQAPNGPSSWMRAARVWLPRTDSKQGASGQPSRLDMPRASKQRFVT